MELTAKSSIIMGDPSQLQNVLINLGINASHAMPSGGTMSLRTKNLELDRNGCTKISPDLLPGKYLEITFADTGVGIASAHLARIFEPFFTTKERGKGTGLGLASAFGTIQQHKGAISVHSKVEQGTEFDLYFPLCNEGVDSSLKSIKPILGSGRILVVDDEPVMRSTAKASLNKFGYQVLLAENGKEGLQIFKENHDKIDLVILDMVMPEMNGKDCFMLMKEIAPNIRAILSSGFSQENDILAMKDLGLRGFIQKPFRSAKLSHVINNALKS